MIATPLLAFPFEGLHCVTDANGELVAMTRGPNSAELAELLTKAPALQAIVNQFAATQRQLETAAKSMSDGLLKAAMLHYVYEPDSPPGETVARPMLDSFTAGQGSCGSESH